MPPVPDLATSPLAALEWDVWSTRARLVVTDADRLTEARAVADRHLDAVDRAASRFRADSEVSRLAARSQPGPVRVSALLAELVGAALDAARATGGDVDPTLGADLVALGYDDDITALPDDRPSLVVPAGPVSVRRPVSWRDVHLDGRDLDVPPGCLLDLGATAKAAAADHLATTLARRLGCGVLVALGGDVRVDGREPAEGWTVRVQDGDGEPASTVGLTGARAVATSSTRRRTWTVGGEVRHHVLDPRTRRPAVVRWRTVSVAADTCLTANTLSTAAVVRGEQAPALLRAAGVPARLVGADGTVTTVGGWPA